MATIITTSSQLSTQHLMPLNNVHFELSDIQNILKKAIGLRHLSSQEAAAKEKTNGVVSGTSFNLTFQPGKIRGSFSLFEGFPAYLSDPKYTDQKKAEAIESYEEAVLGTIEMSLNYDAANAVVIGATTYRKIWKIWQNSAFMLIDYSGLKEPKDFDFWGKGLGRYPKDHITPEKIITLLPPLTPEEPLDKVIETDDEWDKFYQTVRDKIFSKVVLFLRSNHHLFKDLPE